MTTPQPDGAAKLAAVLKPFMDELKKDLTATLVAMSQEQLIATEGVGAKVDVLSKLVSGAKKPIREKKTVETPGASPATTVVAQKNFPVNKLVYFRDQFKTNPEYRARFVTKELQDLMDADATISAKTNETQKLVAQATYCWNYIKQNKPDVGELIEKDYIEAKALHEANSKLPQQVAEPVTP